MIPLSHYLVLSAVLFSIGTAGVFMRRKSHCVCTNCAVTILAF